MQEQQCSAVEMAAFPPFYAAMPLSDGSKHGKHSKQPLTAADSSSRQRDVSRPRRLEPTHCSSPARHPASPCIATRTLYIT